MAGEVIGDELSVTRLSSDEVEILKAPDTDGTTNNNGSNCRSDTMEVDLEKIDLETPVNELVSDYVNEDIRQLKQAMPSDLQTEIIKDDGGDLDNDSATTTTNLDTNIENNISENETMKHDHNELFKIDFGSENFLTLVAESRDEFKESDECFLKGCKWAPDGLCILTNSDDNILRIFNAPSFLHDTTSVNKVPEELSPVLRMKGGDTVYDFDWYPLMNSQDHSTCCFVSTAKDHPLHLWDAFTGDIRCSYVSKNHLDEVVAANSVAFNKDGTKLFCGFNKAIKVFDTNRPGFCCAEYATASKNTIFTQSGIISSIAFSNTHGKIFALGSFGKSVGVYSEDDAGLICMLPGKVGAITQVQFSRDGTHLFAGARKNDDISCWDVRNLERRLFTLKRNVTTNQRIQFDIHWSDRYLFSGNTDGRISAWELDSAQPALLHTFPAHVDAANGLSIHPFASLLASTSGQRHFCASSSSDSDGSQAESIDNSLLFWKFNQAF